MTDRLTALRGLLTKVEADRQTQEAVAAALMEAVGKVNEACDGSLSLQSRSDEDCAYDDGVRECCAAATHAIRALITETAQTALAKLLAAAERQMLQEALEVCDQRAALLRDQDDLNDWYRGAELCAQDVSAMLVQREQKAARAGAIQKEGGA